MKYADLCNSNAWDIMLIQIGSRDHLLPIGHSKNAPFLFLETPFTVQMLIQMISETRLTLERRLTSNLVFGSPIHKE